MRIGAHQSVAGGHHNAFALAEEDGCEAIQVFTKNASQWKEPTIAPEQRDRFKEARAASRLGSAPILCHDSYLINLCSNDEPLRTRSREALVHEALRCEELGIDHVVLHPGAHVGAGAEAGVARAAENLAWVLERTRGANVSLLVENTAGQGSVVAARFEELGAILRGAEELAGGDARARLGTCIDTCHCFAAGYDLSTKEGFDAAWAELDRHVGVSRIKAMHLNDSQKGLGCRVDRHERVGEGALGVYAFWRLMNDPALAHVVGVLETPSRDEEDAPAAKRAFRDQLEAMRAMVGAPAPAPVAPAAAFALQVQEPAKPKKRGKRPAG